MAGHRKTQKKRASHHMRRKHKGGNGSGRTTRVANLIVRTERPKCEVICSKESNDLMNAILADNSVKERRAKQLLDKCKEATRCE